MFQAAPDVDQPSYALVRAAIGDEKAGIRPHHYALKAACPNYCYAMRNFGYVEEKKPENGIGERTQKRDRGMADLARWFFDAKLDRWPAVAEPMNITAPTFQSRASRDAAERLARRRR